MPDLAKRCDRKSRLEPESWPTIWASLVQFALRRCSGATVRRRDASWGTATRRHCAVRRSDAGPADRRAVPAGPPRGAARAISGCRPSEGRAEKIEPMDYRYLGSMFRGPPHWGGNRILYTLGAEAGRWRQHPGTAAVAGVRVPRGGSGCGRSRATGGLRRVGAPAAARAHCCCCWSDYGRGVCGPHRHCRSGRCYSSNRWAAPAVARTGGTVRVVVGVRRRGAWPSKES